MFVADVIEVGQRLGLLVTQFDPDVCDGQTAARYAEAFAHIERLAAAGKLEALERVDATNAFRHDGSGTANTAEWLARKTGTSTSDAARATNTARNLRKAPRTRAALKRGKLSAEQANEVAKTAAKDPESERSMLEKARSSSVEDLKAEGLRRRAAADDQDARRARQQQMRCLRRDTDEHGMRRYAIKLTPTQNTTFEPVLDAWIRRIIEQARHDGIRDTHEQYGADALTAMAHHLRRPTTPNTRTSADTGTGSSAPDAGRGAPDATAGRTDDDAGGGAAGTETICASSSRAGDAPTPTRTPKDSKRAPAATVHALLIVDAAAIRRGTLGRGERCEIAGVGPIDIETARALLGDAIVDILVRDGIDITTVAHAGRAANRTQKAALLASFECSIRGCNHNGRIEIDHITGYANTRTTDYQDLCPLCRHHHKLKTHKHWTLSPPGPDGKRNMHPPDHPPPNDDNNDDEPLALVDP